jgi:O-antigen ligase/tetratricopeptide (TPR) repeat protein
MTKGNFLHRLYFWTICVILCLPLLSWGGLFNPPDWGKNIVFRSIVAIMLFVFLWKNWGKTNALAIFETFKKNKIVWILSAYLAIYFLASMFSPAPLFSLWGSPYRGGGFVNFAFYFVFLFLVVLLFDKKDWKKFFDFSIIIGLLVSLVAVFQYFGIFSSVLSQVQSRPPATMGNPIMLATYLLLLIFIAIAFALAEKNKHKKIFYWGSIAVFLFIILITESRAAWLGILIAGAYFLFFYRATTNIKRINILKISAGCVLGLAVLAVIYVNTSVEYRKFSSQNRILNSITNRLDWQNFLKDPRFAGWKIELNAIKDRPWLGYGIENSDIGFNMNYDPTIPNIDRDVAWWDRPHNMVLQTASDAGIFAAIIYIALFVVLFWQLARDKSGNILHHAMQTTLIAYFVASFFSFDTFGSYILFFLIIAYCLMPNEVSKEKIFSEIKSPVKTFTMIFLFFVLVIFLWQYNWVPLSANSKINEAEAFVKMQKNCNQAFILMDQALKSKSFLDAYTRLTHNEVAVKCNDIYPESQDNLARFEKGIELTKEAIKIQPTYARYYIFIGETSMLLARQEDDENKKAELVDQARTSLIKATQLAPKHHETFLLLAKVEIVSNNFQKAKEYSQKCIDINKNYGDCHLELAISQIYLNDVDSAKQNIQTASEKTKIDTEDKLLDLSQAYEHIGDYESLVPIFEKLIELKPNDVQNRSTLAFVYSQVGQYKKAREQALKVLELSPESKDNVEEFLRTLPY